MIVGDRVIKDTGDYVYEGEIVAVFKKLSGEPRYVVEHTDLHILFIFNAEQIRLIDGAAEPA